MDRSEQFFVRGEGECTKEMGAGQFSIFGAIEEKEAPDFRGFLRIKERDWKAVARCVIVRVPASVPRLEEYLLEWAAGISTEGSQEMQKGGARDHWSEVGFEFRVFTFQFWFGRIT
jgi:hypothetical protein